MTSLQETFHCQVMSKVSIFSVSTFLVHQQPLGKKKKHTKKQNTHTQTKHTHKEPKI